MTGIEFYIHQKHKALAKELLISKSKGKDKCGVCSGDLYLDGTTSRRIGLIEDNRIVGWMCPMCKSQFDEDDGLVRLFSDLEEQGEG